MIPQWLQDIIDMEKTEVNVNFSIAVEVGDDVIVIPPDDDPPVEPPEEPPITRLVEMTAKEQYKKPVGTDASGKPIMEGGIVGFRAEIGDRFLVEIPAVEASGGAKYYKVWIGENEDKSARGWYIAKDKTKVI